MAFTTAYLSRISTTANGLSPIWWSYIHPTDSIAQIMASGYFNSAGIDLTTGKGKFKVNDIINVNGINGNNLLRIASVTTNVTVALYPMAYSVSMYQWSGESDSVVANNLQYHRLTNSEHTVDFGSSLVRRIHANYRLTFRARFQGVTGVYMRMAINDIYYPTIENFKWISIVGDPDTPRPYEMGGTCVFNDTFGAFTGENIFSLDWRKTIADTNQVYMTLALDQFQVSLICFT